MAAIPETHVLTSSNSFRLFQGQNGCVYRSALADGVLWVCQIGEMCVLIAASLEEFCCEGLSVNAQVGFLFVVCYYVELLS